MPPKAIKRKTVRKQLPMRAYSKTAQMGSGGGWGNRYGSKHWTSRSVIPFPSRQMLTLKYCDVFQFTTNATFSNYNTEYDFRLSSLFDTDLTGTGHQPYPHDTIALIYKRYLVKDVKVKLEWFDPSVDGVVVGYNLMHQSNTNGMGLGELAEKPFTKLVSLNNSGSQNATQVFTVGMHTLLGLKKKQYQDQENYYGADFGQNPSQGAFLRCTYMHPSALSATVRLKITLLYNVQVYNLNMLSIS